MNLRICLVHLLLAPVGDPPEVVRPLKDVTAVAPKSAVLECSINLGDPEAKVKFFKDAKEVYGGGKYDVEVVGQRVTLTIGGLELGDAGRYRCEAANKLGTVKTEAKLTVHGGILFEKRFLHQIRVD